MKTKSLISLMLAIFIISISFISCEKDPEKSPAILNVEDDIIAEMVYEDLFAEVDAAMDYMESVLYGGMKKSESVVTCRTRTVEQPSDTVFWPRTITIDFGDGCTNPNGVIHKGKIITIVSSGKFWMEGHTRTTTLENYYVNGNIIEGTKVVSNEGKNSNGNLVFSETLTGGKVITPEGKEINREFAREREWVAGQNTPRIRLDDEYLVTGVVTGTNRKGLAYTRTINVPLHIKLACRWIVAGTIVSQAEDMPEAILDYGNGECDSKATVTVNGDTKEISLHR